MVYLNTLGLDGEPGGDEVGKVSDSSASVSLEQEVALLGVVERGRREPQPNPHLHFHGALRLQERETTAKGM